MGGAVGLKAIERWRCVDANGVLWSEEWRQRHLSLAVHSINLLAVKRRKSWTGACLCGPMQDGFPPRYTASKV
jgi:hypothetical protein